MSGTIILKPSVTAARAALLQRRHLGPWRVGLLGAGYIAQWHAEAVGQVRTARVVAVCDVSPTRRHALAARVGAQTYADLATMLAEAQLDVVHVLLPPDHHVEAACQVIDAGVHVLVEKPMGVDAGVCRRLVETAQAKGVRLGVSHNFLFAEEYELLRDDVNQAKLGPVDHLMVKWQQPLPILAAGPFDSWMLARPGNIVLEIGPHPLGIVLDLVGNVEQLEVRAEQETCLPPDSRPFYRRWHVAGWRGHTRVDIHLGFGAGFAEHSVHVRGLVGSATADLERNLYILRRHTRGAVDADRYWRSTAEGRAIIRRGRRNFLRYALSKFRLSRRGNAFGASIAGAVRAFYGGLEDGAGLDRRLQGETGAAIVELATRIVARSGVETRMEAVRLAPVGPPSRGGAAPVLVLGGTGFIGRELVRLLQQRGCAVRVLTRHPRGTDLALALGVEVIGGSVLDAGDLDRALDGVATVYHLARANVKTWGDYLSSDVEATRLIGRRCLAHGVHRLIYTGTIDSYYAGDPRQVITEDTPLDPRIHGRNYYARAKAMGEALLADMRQRDGLPVVIVRPGIVIGRGGSPLHWGVGMWNGPGVVQVWGAGQTALPLVLVEDVADGLVRVMETQGVDGQSFNLIGDARLTAREYLDEFERAARVRLQRFYTPVWRFYASGVAKWMVKVAVRHHDRRCPSWGDWNSRTQSARFDCSKTKRVLGWSPVSDVTELVARGIHEPVCQWLA